LGISKLPAISIDDIVVQWRLSAHGDIVSWLDKLVLQEDRALRSQTAQSGWPGSVGEAVALLVEGLCEREMLDIAAADNEALFSLMDLWAGVRIYERVLASERGIMPCSKIAALNMRRTLLM
jgi:hypothetical protein